MSHRRSFSFTFEPRGENLPEENKTFVSQHYKLADNEVPDYLKRKSLLFTKAGDQIKVKMCPFCHAIKNDPTNMNTLNILAESGAHNCFRCGARGSW